MSGINPNTEDITKLLPSWLIDISDGKTVFGKKRDKLILEIFDAGGLYLLGEQCKLSLEPNEKCPNVRVSLKSLNDLKAKLITEHDVAMRMMKSGKVTFSVIEKQEGPNGSLIVAKGTVAKAD